MTLPVVFSGRAVSWMAALPVPLYRRTSAVSLGALGRVVQSVSQQPVPHRPLGLLRHHP